MKEPLIKANRVFKYSITFQETNEESRELSDFSDSGFIIENETDEIGDILKLAQQTYGIYYPISFGVWESTTPEQNVEYFEKGIETYYALFIENEDGTAITEEEYDFITFLLSDGNYNKSEFTDYAVGGVVLGALALGVGGLIAYYYFNKRKKGYPTGSAWTKEHYHDNEDEDYEVEPSKRKVPARNRKFVNGGGVDGGIANENLIVYFESGKGESFIYRITKLNGEELYASWLGSSATKEIIELKYKLESKYSKFIFNNDHSDSRYYGVIVINDGKVEEYNTNTDKWLNKKRELGLEKFVNGGGVDDLKNSLKNDFSFTNLFLPNERPFFLKGDTKVIQNKGMIVITDGKREIIFSSTKPYSKFKKLGNASSSTKELFNKKFVNGGTTTTRPTTTPEVVPDTDTKPRKPKTPYTPKHTPLIKPKARKYDFILIKK